MHTEYTIRAATHGVHVLCEKPMAVTVAKCRRMIRACDSTGVKLTIAYRLHFDPLHLDAIDAARRGSLGELKYVSASFSMRVKPGNIPTKPALGGGTLYDIGVYCINGVAVSVWERPSGRGNRTGAAPFCSNWASSRGATGTQGRRAEVEPTHRSAAESQESVDPCRTGTRGLTRDRPA